MFILAGNPMNGAGITRRLLDLSDVLLGHMKGSLAQVNVLLSTLMGGMSGSCITDAAVETRMLGPEMIKRVYSKGYTVAVNVWTFIITPIIPPGIGFILYGTVGQVSIGRLFAGEIVPGAMITILYMLAVAVDARLKGFEPGRRGFQRPAEVLRTFLECFWALVFPFALLFGLRTGVFTPSEIGSFAVFYAMMVSVLAHRELNRATFREVDRMTTSDIGGVMFIIALLGHIRIWDRSRTNFRNYGRMAFEHKRTGPLCSVFYSYFVFDLRGHVCRWLGIDTYAYSHLPSHSKEGRVRPCAFWCGIYNNDNPWKYDPPVGAAMYASCTILDCSIQKYVKESISFFIATVLAIFCLIMVPELSLYVPELLFGR